MCIRDRNTVDGASAGGPFDCSDFSVDTLVEVVPNCRLCSRGVVPLPQLLCQRTVRRSTGWKVIGRRKLESDK
eukprot:6992650-Pyramimonas_sp.AAC.1